MENRPIQCVVLRTLISAIVGRALVKNQEFPQSHFNTSESQCKNHSQMPPSSLEVRHEGSL